MNVLLSLWLVISPWILGFADVPRYACDSTWLLGGAILAVSLAVTHLPERWYAAIAVALGVLSLLSPWVLAFSRERAATVNAMVIGLLVAVSGVRALLDESLYGEWLREWLDEL